MVIGINQILLEILSCPVGIDNKTLNGYSTKHHVFDLLSPSGYLVLSIEVLRVHGPIFGRRTDRILARTVAANLSGNPKRKAQ